MQGSYLNRTTMENLRNTIADFACRKLPPLDTLFGPPYVPGAPGIRNRLSKVAAMVNTTAGIINWLEKEIEEDGVDALPRFMLGNKLMGSTIDESRTGHTGERRTNIGSSQT